MVLPIWTVILATLGLSTCPIGVGQVAQTNGVSESARFIEPLTVAAYEDLGAAYDVLNVTQLGFSDVGSRKLVLADHLPVFTFPVSLQNGKMPKLPAVGVPFGLVLRNVSLQEPGLMDSALEELSTL